MHTKSVGGNACDTYWVEKKLLTFFVFKTVLRFTNVLKTFYILKNVLHLKKIVFTLDKNDEAFGKRQAFS